MERELESFLLDEVLIGYNRLSFPRYVKALATCSQLMVFFPTLLFYD